MPNNIDSPTIELTPQHVFGVFVVVQRGLLRGGVISRSMYQQRIEKEAARLGLDARLERWVGPDGEVQ